MMSRSLFICCFLLVLVVASSSGLVLQFHYPNDALKSRTNNSEATLHVRGNGCGLNWDQGVEAEHTTDDLWVLEVDCSTSLEAGAKLEFKPLVNDETWQIGANFMVAGPKDDMMVDVYPFFFTTVGKYTVVKDVYSKELNNTRDLVVYVPPSYHENTLKTYENVLIMHDGQNLFDPSTAFMGNPWYCQNTIDMLVTTGGMDEIIIVGVNNSPDRNEEMTYSYDPTEKFGGKGDLYLDFIESTVMPKATSMFRFADSFRDNLGILGSSLGGLISCFAGWTRSHVYKKAGCMSSSFWWNSQDFNSTIIPKTKPSHDVSFYLDSGDSGQSQDDKTETLLVRSDMEALGWKMNSTLFYYLDKGGEHNEYYWGKRFHFPMQDFYPIKPLKTATKIK